jgi:hypothetical protein
MPDAEQMQRFLDRDKQMQGFVDRVSGIGDHERAIPK